MDPPEFVRRDSQTTMAGCVREFKWEDENFKFEDWTIDDVIYSGVEVDEFLEMLEEVGQTKEEYDVAKECWQNMTATRRDSILDDLDETTRALVYEWSTDRQIDFEETAVKTSNNKSSLDRKKKKAKMKSTKKLSLEEMSDTIEALVGVVSRARN